jgi:hypothetical protein
MAKERAVGAWVVLYVRSLVVVADVGEPTRSF